MAKRIVAKTGSYTNNEGQEKGEYTKLGVMLNNQNGDYMLLDPTISLAGVLLKQNALAAKTNGQQRDMVMISIFDDDNKNQQSNNNQSQQQGGYQQQPAQQQPTRQQAPQQQGGFQQAPRQQDPQQQPAQAPDLDDGWDDDIPF